MEIVFRKNKKRSLNTIKFLAFSRCHLFNVSITRTGYVRQQRLSEANDKVVEKNKGVCYLFTKRIHNIIFEVRSVDEKLQKLLRSNLRFTKPTQLKHLIVSKLN